MHRFAPGDDYRGPLWVVHLLLPDLALDLGDAYADTVQTWLASIPANASLTPPVEVLDRRLRHLTLAAVAAPADTIDVEQLYAELTTNLADLPPVELDLGPPLVNDVAIELYIRPTAALASLHERVSATITRTTGGPPAGAGRAWRPHTALAYCRHDVDTHGLQPRLLRTPGPIGGFLEPVTVYGREVALVREETHAPVDGQCPDTAGRRFLWHDTTRRIQLR
ncbi:2'-5' RNA ligase family protein [Kutzneria chonburiensis]|uniref:2'-5' RNA ligase family protein n=1 Tax=Kutzneria chonburiensis TaxID=1483604 RepID=A0ABV6MK31_9PSEU|nr:2'-5' RNA ligase family protein [Kutzneria chonburiensis]